MRIVVAAMAVLFLITSAVGEAAHPAGKFHQILGKKVWVEEEGTGEPLVLIPGGGGGSHDYYHPYFGELARNFRVIYYDGFGRGNSEKAKQLSEYSFARDIEELEQLRKALGLGAINVYGNSYGGMVAQGYAIKYPGSVKRLILANTFIRAADWQESNDNINSQIRMVLPEVWREVERLRAAGHVSSSPEMGQAYLGHFPTMLALFYVYDPASAAKIEFSEHTFNAAQYYQICGKDADFVVGGDMAGYDYREQVKNMPFPILVLAGRADGIVLPRLAMEFQKHVPKAEFVMFEKSGHFPFMEETARHTEVVRGFLSR